MPRPYISALPSTSSPSLLKFNSSHLKTATLPRNSHNYALYSIFSKDKLKSTYRRSQKNTTTLERSQPSISKLTPRHILTEPNLSYRNGRLYDPDRRPDRIQVCHEEEEGQGRQRQLCFRRVSLALRGSSRCW